eukprot:403340767
MRFKLPAQLSMNCTAGFSLSINRFIVKQSLIVVMLLNLIIFVEGRGKKKKRSGGSLATCTMDCSPTCCLDSVCATDAADCAGYVNRELMEMYFGFSAIIALMLGIPSIICLFNFCLLHRFCKEIDEADGVEQGGFTLCQIVSNAMTCRCLNFLKQKRPIEGVITKAKMLNNFDFSEDDETQHRNELNRRTNEDGDEEQRLMTQQQLDNKTQKRNMLLLKPKRKRKRNRCVKCLCIVFCCLDSNINDFEDLQLDQVNLASENQRYIRDLQREQMQAMKELDKNTEDIGFNSGSSSSARSKEDLKRIQKFQQEEIEKSMLRTDQLKNPKTPQINNYYLEKEDEEDQDADLENEGDEDEDLREVEKELARIQLTKKQS